jgi:hypothetical protein
LSDATNDANALNDRSKNPKVSFGKLPQLTKEFMDKIKSQGSMGFVFKIKLPVSFSSP